MEITQELVHQRLQEWLENTDNPLCNQLEYVKYSADDNGDNRYWWRFVDKNFNTQMLIDRQIELNIVDENDQKIDFIG